MERRTVGLAEAKAHLSELTDRAAHGEEIVITKRGRAVAILSQVRVPRRPRSTESKTRRAPARAFRLTPVSDESSLDRFSHDAASYEPSGAVPPLAYGA